MDTGVLAGKLGVGPAGVKYLRQIDGREQIQSLSKQRQQCEKDLSKTYDKLIQHKTYLGLKKNITPKVECALVMFSAAIRKIGKGTGYRAHRYRRDAQDAMEKSYSAVPCWIMPSWRSRKVCRPQSGRLTLLL